jgi:uncharacterized membrane protein
MIQRLLKQFYYNLIGIRSLFPIETQKTIQSAIARSEASHRGEIRIVIEAGLGIQQILFHQSARSRALDLFSELRIWDTEANNGVLIYLLLADHNIEIVADRGLNRVVSKNEFEQICKSIEDQLKNGRYEAGLVLGIESLTEIMRANFPLLESPQGREPDELPDRLVIL